MQTSEDDGEYTEYTERHNFPSSLVNNDVVDTSPSSFDSNWNDLSKRYDWLREVVVGEGKKYVRKDTSKQGVMHQIAHWALLGAVPSARQPKAKALVNEIAQTHQLLNTGNYGNALVRTIANATQYPKEMIQAGMNYAYKSLMQGNPPTTSNVPSNLPQIITPQNDLKKWGWAFGVELLGSKIASLALKTPAAMLSYYSIMGEFPFADKWTVDQVKGSINDVKKKIQRKYEDEGILLDEPHLVDIATKLLVLSYLYPTDTAQGILDFAVEHITDFTMEAIAEERRNPRERKPQDVQMPGAWIGGRGKKRRRRITRPSRGI